MLIDSDICSGISENDIWYSVNFSGVVFFIMVCLFGCYNVVVINALSVVVKISMI